MPRKAIGPTPMTPAERAARSRRDRKAYVAALEAMALDLETFDASLAAFRDRHAATIARVRTAAGKAATQAAHVKAEAVTEGRQPRFGYRPNTPQTLARAVVQPRFRGKK